MFAVEKASSLEQEPGSLSLRCGPCAKPLQRSNTAEEAGPHLQDAESAGWRRGGDDADHSHQLLQAA